MKDDASSLSRVVLGAFFGALLTAAALFVLMFIAAGVSAGAFTLLIEEVLGYFFGEHSMVVLFSLGAAVGAVFGACRARNRLT